MGVHIVDKIVPSAQGVRVMDTGVCELHRYSVKPALLMYLTKICKNGADFFLFLLYFILI